ncbi:MAG: hypothetical protein JKY30_13005 [Flavobacteriales bacterium]|nr:hypothetical protein [Flavobacteriales bacterium]
MIKTKNLLGISILTLAIVTSCNDAELEEKVHEKENYTTTTDNSCLADSDWFKIDSITHKRKTDAPKEDSHSVFGNNVTVSNCNFHQWSWQKFLWLTNEDTNGTPLFMDSLFQVNAQTIPVKSVNKKIILVAADAKQATNSILKTNKSYNSNNLNYTVYYSIHVDSSLYKSIQKYAPMDKSMYKDSTFPVGALELKIAWVNIDALRDTNAYFITDGNIEGIDTRIALLGMHVVGIVYNHPEFVWATFEHHDLSPYYDWAATITTDTNVTSKTNKLFFDSNAVGTLANITYKSDSTNIFAVNQFGVPRQAQDSFLLTSQKEPKNYNNIDAINISVHEQLTDVWNNYFYNGSIWIDTEHYNYPTEQATLLISLSDSIGISAPGKLTRGSVSAYNITMETYEQLGFAPTSIHGQNVSNLGNCFSCHTASRGSALNISHIFNGAVDTANNISIKQTKQKHLDEIQTFIKKMK